MSHTEGAIALIQAELNRLRALIKDAEWEGQTGRDADECCPWCHAFKGAPHALACPAFEEDGTVRLMPGVP